MMEHLINTSMMPNSAAVLQLNCQKSPSVTLSLFNDPHTANFLILALQEPPVNHHTNLPAEHSGWRLVTHQPNALSEDSRP